MIGERPSFIIREKIYLEVRNTDEGTFKHILKRVIVGDPLESGSGERSVDGR